MTDEELRVTMKRIQAQAKTKQEQVQRVAALRNKKEGEVFLAENKKKEGVVALPSGLQYKILKAGDGKKPTEANAVECRYRGTLLNGTEFDSSKRSGKPTVIMPLKALIPGMREALKLMPAGSTWQLFIPSQLAYGERGSGPDIGPNATLIFEFELIAVK
jgi:FKBP-type peptidyl-prolyl cis-trans isomerase FklB